MVTLTTRAGMSQLAAGVFWLLFMEVVSILVGVEVVGQVFSLLKRSATQSV